MSKLTREQALERDRLQVKQANGETLTETEAARLAELTSETVAMNERRKPETLEQELEHLAEHAPKLAALLSKLDDIKRRYFAND